MKRTFFERVVPATMQDKVVPQEPSQVCNRRVSCVQRADEGIAKGFQHLSVSLAYWPRLVTVTQK